MTPNIQAIDTDRVKKVIVKIEKTKERLNALDVELRLLLSGEVLSVPSKAKQSKPTKKKRKGRTWTDEQRKAQAVKMRAINEKKWGAVEKRFESIGESADVNGTNHSSLEPAQPSA